MPASDVGMSKDMIAAVECLSKHDRMLASYAMFAVEVDASVFSAKHVAATPIFVRLAALCRQRYKAGKRRLQPSDRGRHRGRPDGTGVPG